MDELAGLLLAVPFAVLAAWLEDKQGFLASVFKFISSAFLELL